MEHRMRGSVVAEFLLTLLVLPCTYGFVPGVDGPVKSLEALEGGNVTLECDTSSPDTGDQLMLLVWYKDNLPIFSFDYRIRNEWSNESFNTSARLRADLEAQPTTLTVLDLTEHDQGLYHCRVDFSLTPTRNLGVNLTIIILPSQPFFLDEVGNKVENKIGPYHEGDTLVLSCLVIGGHPTPKISWYSGDSLVDESDGTSDVPGIRENVLFLPLTRDSAAPLTCKASNTELAPPVTAHLDLELYLPAETVKIRWLKGAVKDNSLQAGWPAVAECEARGSHPPPDLAWWLDHRHLTKHSNQSLINGNKNAVSQLELIPSVADNGATLSCVATNVVMAPSRGSTADVIKLNVTYSPILELSKIGFGRMNESVELDTLHLECEVSSNPSVYKITWYFNDNEIVPNSFWGDIDANSPSLVILDATRRHSGKYSCAAANSVGESRTHPLDITVFYPPSCNPNAVIVKLETVICKVDALPLPDTYFWHIQPSGLETQHLTTGSSILPLSQVNGPLAGKIQISCEANNGIASQDKACEASVTLEHLRPPTPQQCDLAYEYEEFQMRCIPVENASYYELSVWRMSTSNTSLVLERRSAMGWGNGGQALAHGSEMPWLVRGALGQLRAGDEAGASACNRYGCSRALLLRPTDTLLRAAAPPWWHFLFEKDVGISIGAAVLVVVFVISSVLIIRLARRPRDKRPAPVAQVLPLEHIAREYIDAIEQKRHLSRSIRSCSSGYSGGSLEFDPPPVDRHRKPLYYWEPGPQPDVTMTLSRESAV